MISFPNVYCLFLLRNDELQSIFTTLTHTHFITPDTAQGAVGSHHSNYDEKVNIDRFNINEFHHFFYVGLCFCYFYVKVIYKNKRGLGMVKYKTCLM